MYTKTDTMDFNDTLLCNKTVELTNREICKIILDIEKRDQLRKERVENGSFLWKIYYFFVNSRRWSNFKSGDWERSQRINKKEKKIEKYISFLVDESLPSEHAIS